MAVILNKGGGFVVARGLNRKKSSYKLLLMALPFMVIVLLFNYMPLFGWIYAFFNYKPGVPLFKNEFVGLEYFKLFLTDPIDMLRVMKNTVAFALIGYIVSPLPMIFAIMLNEVKNRPYKKFIQTVTTLPNFVSWVIVFSLTFTIFSSEGLFNNILMKFNLISIPSNVLSDPDAVFWFQTALGQWKSLGWSSIIYLAAIAGIDQELYEAARIDGASRFKSIFYITIPSLMPTFIVLLLLSIGNFVSVGFEQFFVFKNPANSTNIEVLDVYVYRIGLMNQDYSYGVAIGIMKSVVSVTLLFLANFASKRVRGESIV